MSASSVPGLFGPSAFQSEKSPAPASQPATGAGAGDSINPTNPAPRKTNANYLQDKDLNWWLTFARTFKNAVKTPLPDDDSDL